MWKTKGGRNTFSIYIDHNLKNFKFKLKNWFYSSHLNLLFQKINCVEGQRFFTFNLIITSIVIRIFSYYAVNLFLFQLFYSTLKMFEELNVQKFSFHN